MKKFSFLGAGIFVVSALILFSLCIFLIGDRQKAFNRHVDFYTEIANVNGLAPGSIVRVSGFDAGQVESIQIPGEPSQKFRIKLHLTEKLRQLIRNNSIVSVQSDGVVGDKFLQIDGGTDQSQEAAAGATLASKEPIEIAAVLAKATGLIDVANATIVDVKGQLDIALGSATTTIDNANGLVSDARHGNGPVGVMLNDRETAARLKQIVADAQQATANVNQISVHAGQIMTDVQSRNFPAKVDDTLTDAHHAVRQVDQASQQINQASQKVNVTLKDALGPDRSGVNAAENIRDALSNVNQATANMADDTEALKHEFLFRGYFKKRGFYSLGELTPAEYRTNAYFQSGRNQRSWLDAAEIFTLDGSGTEVLSAAGQQQIDRIVGSMKDRIVDQPLVVEGYSSHVSPADQILTSRSRSLLVARYLEERFHLRAEDVGVMPLNSTPPSASGKSSWDGISIVVLAAKK